MQFTSFCIIIIIISFMTLNRDVGGSYEITLSLHGHLRLLVCQGHTQVNPGHVTTSTYVVDLVDQLM